jgi:hypothetical protein
MFSRTAGLIESSVEIMFELSGSEEWSYTTKGNKVYSTEGKGTMKLTLKDERLVAKH